MRKLIPAAILGALCFSASVIVAVLPADATWYSDAVTNLRPGWSQTLVYQYQLVFPAHLTLGDGDAVLVGDGGTDKVSVLDTDGQLYPAADLSSIGGGGVHTLTYQRGRNRLLVFTNDGGLYASVDGSHTLLGNIGLQVNSVAVDSRDDSVIFYGVDDSGGYIRRLDASCTAASTIATASLGVCQIALDEANDKLYYSDTFLGHLEELDLVSGETSTLADPIGTPGTAEAIAVAMGGDGRVYYYSSSDGLRRHEGGTTFTQVVGGGITGAGPFIWSPLHMAFLQGHLGGANIVAFDPASGTTTQTTPPFNARTVVEADDGTILAGTEVDGRYVQRVTDAGYVRHSGDLGGTCAALERDYSGTIYVGLSDGRILTLGPSGETTAWAQIEVGGGTYVLSYDAAESALVAVVPDEASDATTVWRVPLADPVSGITSFETSGVVATAGAADEQGNVYLLDVGDNKVFKVPHGSTDATEFIDGVLSSRAISAPAMEYSREERALVVSTIDNYELWSLDNPARLILADNTGGVDNLTVSETHDKGIVAVHSGRVFRLTPVDDPPVALEDSAMIAENTMLSVSAPGLLGNDSDPEGSAITAYKYASPQHGVAVVEPDGSYTYWPEPNWYGVDTLAYRAYDGSNYSEPATVTVTVTPVAEVPTRIDRTSAGTTLKYGATFTLTGVLRSAGAGLAGQRVSLEYSTDGTHFAASHVATTTSPDGIFRMTVRPGRKTWYRARFAATHTHLASVSSSAIVSVRARVTTPVAPERMRHTRYYAVYGYLHPKHAAGSYPVRIYRWRKSSSGMWRSYGYVRARVSNYSTISRYTLKLRLPHAGRWRLRAYAPADGRHAASWSSGYDYVTVR